MRAIVETAAGTGIEVPNVPVPSTLDPYAKIAEFKVSAVLIEAVTSGVLT